MPKSSQHKLDRVRKPRVHITYDVDTGGAEMKRELPFVMGVMGDFSGNPTEKPAPLSQRKFVEIDRDNFDSVMAKIKPELNFRVKDTLSGKEDSELAVQLKFNSIEDFEPGAVVDQIPALKSLLESRDQLGELLTKLDMSEDLEEQLEQILSDTARVQKTAGELGVSSESGDE